MTHPINIGKFTTTCKELMYVLYMPVRLAGQYTITVPKSLAGYTDLVKMALAYEGCKAEGKYVYLTVKSLWVESHCVGGRPGWHADGFGTDDINYVWVNRGSTEFCNQRFDLSDDHNFSLVQMEAQARQENIIQYPELDVIRIDASNIHRCPENASSGYRTFARVSISNNKYNLAGNAHNHDISYNWTMNERSLERNHTTILK
tara:strand:+ start:827 stop:1435 length:609 start_codon:yes stop_codon:yes gene_type:complete